MLSVLPVLGGQWVGPLGCGGGGSGGGDVVSDSMSTSYYSSTMDT